MFGLQTTITAECSMRRTAVALATATWRTRREHDGMRLRKLRSSWSIGRRVMAFRIFSNMADVHHFEFKLIFDPVIVIVVLSCCCIPNFNKIGSRVRPPDSHKCTMYNALLLGNDRCRPMATASRRTSREHDGM